MFVPVLCSRDGGAGLRDLGQKQLINLIFKHTDDGSTYDFAVPYAECHTFLTEVGGQLAGVLDPGVNQEKLCLSNGLPKIKRKG